MSRTATAADAPGAHNASERTDRSRVEVSHAGGSQADCSPAEGPQADSPQAERSQAEDIQLQALLDNQPSAGARRFYGDGPDDHVEIHGEAASASAVVVFVHGGYFRPGTDLSHTRPMAAALAERGALVVLVEYRREGGYPHERDGVTRAIDFVLGSLSDWGVTEAAGASLTVAGHSAGGALVLSWASHASAAGPQIRLRPLAPVTDFFREVHEGLGDGAVRSYMGRSPSADRAAYLAEDPRSRVPFIPPRFETLVLHGTEDMTVDIEFARTFPAPLQELDGANHFDLVDPQSEHFGTVAEALLG